VSTHTHVHSHGHAHGPAGEHPPAGGPVVLDIGGDIGALIVYLDDEHLIGHELHVRPIGAAGSTTHTGIWRRRLGNRDEVIAIFPDLTRGAYDVFDLKGSVVATVEVVAGEVIELSLRLTAV
jgi:hypothetical protein